MSLVRLLWIMWQQRSYAPSSDIEPLLQSAADPFPGIPKRFFFRSGIEVAFVLGQDEYFVVEAASEGGPLFPVRYWIPADLDERGMRLRFTAALTIQGALGTAAAIGGDFPRIN